MLFDINNPSDVGIVTSALDRYSGLAGAQIPVGLTSGAFDLLHGMHLVYLQRCRRQCNFLIVGVDSDDLVRERKGSDRPIVPEHQRASLVANLVCSSAVFVLGNLKEFETAVREFNVTSIFRNQDVKPEDVVGADRAKVIVVPDINQVDSTSRLVEEVKRRMKKPENTGV